MYNGLGLRTARGSGTNGYVQRNLSFAKPKLQHNYSYDQPPPKPARKPSADLLLHRNKRQVEVECLEYEEKLLEAERYPAEEVKQRVDEYRAKLLAKLEDSMKRKEEKFIKEQKQSEMDRLKDAFGIKDEAKEGDAFKFEPEKARQERLARYAEEDRLERRKRLRDR